MKRYRLRVPGAAGAVETVIDDPGAERRGLFLMAHPHPLHGGTLDNKVVATLARTAAEADWVAVRPNFRGVGASEGAFDHGVGETEDLVAVARFVEARYPALPWVLAGFSFGAYVQHRVVQRVAAHRLILVAPAVHLYAFDEVPADTVVLYGDTDEVVPPDTIADWARAQGLETRVLAGAGHFFHGRLRELATAFREVCPC